MPNQLQSSTSAAVKHIALVARLKLDISKFVDHIEQTPFVPPEIVPGLDDASRNTVESANSKIEQGFKDVQGCGTELLSEVNELQQFIDKAKVWARNGSELSTPIKSQIDAILAKPTIGDSDRNTLVELFKAYIEEAKKFETQADDSKKKLTNSHGKINDAIRDITAGMDMYDQIGKKAGDKLNLGNFSEPDLREKLHKRVDSLTDKISDLESKINGDIAGATIGGIAGVGLALANAWNPIGWVVGAGTVIGEVFGGEAIQSEYDTLHSEQEELALTQEEMKLLTPLQNASRLRRQLKKVVGELTKTTEKLTNIGDDLSTYVEDTNKLDKSTLHILAKISWENMKSDLTNIQNDLKILDVSPNKAQLKVLSNQELQQNLAKAANQPEPA